MTILASPRLVAQKPFHLGICKSLKNHLRNRLRWTAQNQMFLGCLKCAWRAIHSSSTLGWREPEPRGWTPVSDSRSAVSLTAGSQIWKSGLSFLENKRRTANPLDLKVDTHLHTVGDPDEGDTTVHAVFLTIKSHGPYNRTGACSLARTR